MPYAISLPVLYITSQIAVVGHSVSPASKSSQLAYSLVHDCFVQPFPVFLPMQPYNNNEPSLPSVMSRDPEAETLTSQTTSTAPTSTAPPRLPIAASMASINASDVGRQPLAASNTLPVLTMKEGRRGRVLPSSATWTSSMGDLAMLSDTDEVQDRRKFIQEYNRLAKKVYNISV
ncbi:hypothetical protein LY78DRAFT_75351 [Colletotrichum sublineola]|nr:hypothetical protein LY78DRAFT_75351 [Colletotrichum sublineola]